MRARRSVHPRLEQIAADDAARRMQQVDMSDTARLWMKCSLHGEWAGVPITHECRATRTDSEA
jgi:hypothetical protein